MKKTKKVLVLLMAGVMMIGSSMSVSSAAPTLSTHYCPTHNKALVYQGQSNSIKCLSCGKSAINLFYTCPYYYSSNPVCHYSELRCNQCGAEW